MNAPAYTRRGSCGSKATLGVCEYQAHGEAVCAGPAADLRVQRTSVKSTEDHMMVVARIEYNSVVRLARGQDLN